jgi:hypothetical protein
MIVNNYQQAKVRLDHEGIRVSFGEILFFTGLVLWLIQFYISRTIFLELFGDKILTVTRYFCMLIFFVKIVLTETTLHKRAAAVFITAAAVFIVVQENINTGMPLIQVLLMVYGARNISFRRICKVSLAACTVLWLIPVLTYSVGYNELERSEINGRVREYLNFVFVTFGAINFMNILFCTFYVFTEPDRAGRNGGIAQRKTVPWPLIILMSAITVWLYMVTDTSLPFAICMLFIALYVIVVKFRIPFIRNNVPCRILAATFFPMAAFITYYVSSIYDSKVKWMSKLNSFSHKRVALSKQGLDTYGLHLFGTQIKENTDSTKGAYFYLDSAYIKDMIYFGLIVFIMILVFYTIILYASVVENDRTLAIWMISIALYSMFNNLLLLPAENASMFGIWYALDLLMWHRKKKQLQCTGTKRKKIEHAA